MYLEGRAKPNLMGYKETRPKNPKNEQNSLKKGR